MIRAAERQPAYVLHRRAFRETSVIVDLLSRDFGLVGGVVRGIKGPRRRGYDIEPFGEVAATWRGRGQLVTVLRCESVAPRRLAGDVLFAGFYVNELLIKTLRQEEPVAGLFHHYGQALEGMASGEELEGALRVFERRLLEELGYGLVFDVDVRSGRPIDSGKFYRLVDSEGFQEAASAPMQAVGNGSAPLVLTGSQVAAIDAGDYADRLVRRAAKRIFRRALEPHLDGRQLTTRRLFAARAALPAREIETNG